VTFPARFLWGSAAAAHQVEGGNWNNDWWAFEHAPDTICREPSGDACDHYHRYDEDFALLAAHGQNAHRFSLEWSRIEPEQGEFSSAALDHYARVLDSLERHGLTPVVTLHHFTSPRWFAALGGWASDVAVERFRRYADVVARRLGDRIPRVCSINEPQIVALHGYRTGYFPPRVRDRAAAERVTQHFIDAHFAAVDAFGDAAQVGIAMSITDYQAAEGGEARRDRVHRFMTGAYLEALRERPLGFVGVNYYTRATIGPDGQLPPPDGAEITQMGYEVYPEGFTRVLLEAASTGLPVYVTENGIGTDDDAQRIRYIDRHVRAMHEAMSQGADVRGYLYWSATDNFEWTFGFSRTFGLIGIDRRDFRRIPKPSLGYFGEIARANALDEALTARYLPL
jgi:beta-glucosidase